MSMKETLRHITGTDIEYFISNKGVVVSKKSGGHKILKLFYNGKGYFFCTVMNKSVRKTVRVHRTVAKEFIHNPRNKPCVNHINGVKTDNRVENLEWVTHRENTTHMIKLGLQNQVGENNKMAVLLNSDVLRIKGLLLDGVPQCVIANDYGVHFCTINAIHKGRNWRHIKVEDK